MPGQNVIELGFNEAELSAQQKRVVALLTQIYDLTKQLDGVKISPVNITGFTELNKSVQQQSALLKEINTTLKTFQTTTVATAAAQQKSTESISGNTDAVKQNNSEKQKASALQKNEQSEINELTGAYDKYTGSLLDNLKAFTQNQDILKQNAAEQATIRADIKTNGEASEQQIQRLSELNQQQIEYSNSNKQLGATIRAQTTEQNAASGSLEQLQAQLSLTQAAYKKLDEQGRQSSFGLELKQTIDILNPKVTELEQSLGQFQRNVGNYTKSISILSPALAEIAAKIDALSVAGTDNAEVVNNLKAQYEAIEGILATQQQGFSSVTQELRNNQRALQTLAAAGLEDTEVFKNLQIETANVQRNFNELTQQTKLLASEAPGLGALGKVAQGIGAAYAIGAGAAQLFAGNNEKVQEELTKLVAITTLLQGLGELNNVIKEKNALLTIAQINATKLYNFVLTGSTAEIEANTVALDAGKIAAIGFRSALLLTGIGALAVIIYSLATSTSKFTGEAGKAQDALKEYGDTASTIADGVIKKLDDNIKELNKDIGAGTATAVEDAKQALTVLEAEQQKLLKYKSGKTFELFNFDAYKEGFNDFASFFGITESHLTENQRQQSEIRDKINQAEFLNAIKERRDSINEQIKLQNLQTDLELDANNRITNNEKKSFDDRKSALTKSLADRKSLIEGQLKIDLSTETNPAKRNELFEKANADTIKAQRDADDQLQSLQDAAAQKSLEAYKKYLQDQYDLQKANLNQASDLFKGLADNEKNNSDTRLNALGAYYSIQKKLIEDEADFEIKSQQLTGNAKLAVQVEAGTKLYNLAREQQKALSELYLNAPVTPPIGYKSPEQLKNDAELQKQAAIDLQSDLVDIAKNGSTEQAKVNETGFIEQQTKLELQYKSGEISYKKYQDALVKLVKDGAAAQLVEQIKAAEKLKALASPGSNAYTEQENSIAKLKKALADLGYSYDQINDILKDLGVTGDENLKKLANTLQNIADITANVTAAFTTLGNISFDNQKADLEEIGAQEEKNYEQQQANISNSTQSDSERADQLKILDSEHAARQEEIARRQRQIDNEKAKFDKASSILNIIAGTAAAVVAALGAKPFTPLNIVLASTVGALGAAELAAVIATKVPSYAKGLTDAKQEHYGIVGEAGAERLERPGFGTETVNKATLVKLPVHSNVIPLTRSVNAMANSALGNGLVVMMHNDEKAKDESWEQTKWLANKLIRGQRKIRVNNGKYGFADAMYIAKNIKHTA